MLLRQYRDSWLARHACLAREGFDVRDVSDNFATYAQGHEVERGQVREALTV